MRTSPTYISRLTPKRITIPFRHSFSHASAYRISTAGIMVVAESGHGLKGFGEGCPRPYVTGESLQTASRFISSIHDSILDEIYDLDSLKSWVIRHRNTIDKNPAAWCAVELALLDIMSRAQHQSTESFLGLPEIDGVFHYSAVLGDSDIATFVDQLEAYQRHNFTDYKIKLSGDIYRDRGKFAAIRDRFNGILAVRADANNLWKTTDEVIAYVRSLDYPLTALEEPLQTNSYKDNAAISKALDIPVILDESFLRIEDFKYLEDTPGKWIINARVSKMGGILRTLAIMERASQLAIPVIVGAQVGETSLLTRAGITAACAARDRLWAQEGAFGTWLLTHDICKPSLMFGHGGILAKQELRGIGPFGSGLDIVADDNLLQPMP